MPISSGFGYRQTVFPARKPIVRPEIVRRATKENRRNKNRNDLFLKPKATAGGQLPAQRLTAFVKQPLRSDTFTLPRRRDETNFKVPKVDQTPNGSRRRAEVNESTFINPRPLPLSAEYKHTGSMRNHRSMPKSSNPVVDRQHLQRRPIRFSNDYNNTYYSSPPASPPVYYQKNAPLADPLPQGTIERSRHTRPANDDYVIHRRKDSPTYASNDYHKVSDIPTISYMTSLPPITSPTNQTAPTVIIHSRRSPQPEPPTVIPSVTTLPTYSSSTPLMFLPSATAPTSNFVLPTSNMPSFAPTTTTTMIVPTGTAPTQPYAPTFFLPSSAAPPYLSQPFFYPFPHANPLIAPRFPPPPPPPPPAPVPTQQTIISQSSSSSVAAPVSVKTENKTEENNTTITLRPNRTLQVKMLDEDNPRSQRVVRMVRDFPYQEADDVYYVESEPKRIIYEPPPRRTTVIRRPSPSSATDYVYVDDSPSIRRPPYRSEVVYIDNDRSLEYDEEYVYVDRNGNEIDYIYDEPSYHRRNYRKSHYPPSTNIVYQ